MADTLRRLTAGALTAPAAPESHGPHVAPGEIVDGRYRVIEKLGEGGMGAVFKVEHTRMGKLMALKLLQRSFLRDRSVITSFEREAQLVSRLSCTNTVSVFDFGEIPQHGLYMAMEYVPGRNLASLIDADGPFSERSAIGIAIQILHSLAEAHDAGIIHRDIKPANVMLLRTREAKDFVKVLDFGIARLVGQGEQKQEGVFLGTAEYAAPEQIRGEPVDARADLYALAATLFELITGRPPFTGETPVEVCMAQLGQAPPRPSEVAPAQGLSAEFEAILLRALSKAPADRFASADQMRLALDGLGDRYSSKIALGPVKALSDAVAVDESIAQRGDWDAFERGLVRSVRTRRRLIVAGVTVAIGGLLAGAIALVRQNQPKPTDQQLAVAAEREPNNAPDQANVVSVARPIRGTIGARLSDSESDVDAFEFVVPPPGPARVTLTASAVPNVNLAIDVLRREGNPHDGVVYRTYARIDDQPLHSRLPERMDDLRLAAGTYVVQLRDRRWSSERDVTRPRENSTDLYELRITLDPVAPLDEIEPNDTAADRQRAGLGPIAAGTPILGHTGQGALRERLGGVAAARWDDDEFVLQLGPGATHGCALLVGVPDATLALSLTASSAGRAVRTSVRAQEVGAACAATTDPLVARVELELGGNAQDRYMLVAIDDGPTGLAGAERVAQILGAAGRAAEAKRLMAKASLELPRAPWAIARPAR